MDRRRWLSTVFDFFISTIEPGWYIRPLNYIRYTHIHVNIYRVSKMTVGEWWWVDEMDVLREQMVEGDVERKGFDTLGWCAWDHDDVAGGEGWNIGDDGWWLPKDGKWFILSARWTGTNRSGEEVRQTKGVGGQQKEKELHIHDWQVEPSGGRWHVDVDWWSLPVRNNELLLTPDFRLPARCRFISRARSSLSRRRRWSIYTQPGYIASEMTTMIIL